MMADWNTTFEGMDSSETDAFAWGAVGWHWWTFAQTFLIFLGVIGNSGVIYIYTSKLRECSSMNKLIRCLAIADLCTSLSLAPIPPVERVPASFLGHVYCKVVHANSVLWISIIASVYTLTMMSMNRCLAIVYPHQYRCVFSKSRTKYIISLIWVASFLTNAYSYVANYRDDGSGTCAWSLGGAALQASIGAILFSLEYFIPVVIMVSTHLLASRTLRTQAMAMGKHAGPDNRRGTRRERMMLRVNKRVLLMLFVVVLCFIICWTADQVAFLLLNTGVLHYTFLYSNLYHALVLAAYINSCVNPFIYTASNPQFRRALVTFFKARETSRNSEDSAEVTTRETTVFSVDEATRA